MAKKNPTNKTKSKKPWNKRSAARGGFSVLNESEHTPRAVVAVPLLLPLPGWVLLHFGGQRRMSCNEEEMGC